MNELAIVMAVSLIGGVFLGALMMRVMFREIGLPPDERAREIDKLVALKTLELVLLVDIILLFYNLLIARDQSAVNTAVSVLAAVFFGIWIFRAYYARRM